MAMKSGTLWMRALSTALLVVLILLLAVPQVAAYTITYYNGNPIKDKDGKLTFRASAVGFPSSGNTRPALETALARWNQCPGKFTFYVPNWGDGSVGRYNGQNEVWFTTSQNILDGAPAKCIKTYAYLLSNPHIIEADMVFDADVPWSFTSIQSNKWNYGGNYRSFIGTAIHEAGHAFGLKHNNYSYNIMGQDTTHIHANNGAVRPYAGEDGCSGELFLFGSQSPAQNDLSISQWKYDKADGEYSQHIRCKVYSQSTGNIISNNSFNGQPRYNVNKGSSYDVQFTYENNGLNNFNGIKVGFFVSTNDHITTLDQRIGGTTLNLARNQVYTRKLGMTIPAGLVSGATYYLGVVVDEDSAISEVSEANNRTYHQIRIN
jgi:hypothetical protein